MACKDGDGCKQRDKCRFYCDNICSDDDYIGKKNNIVDTPLRPARFLPVEMLMESSSSFVLKLDSFLVKFVRDYPLTSLISLRTLGIITP